MKCLAVILLGLMASTMSLVASTYFYEPFAYAVGEDALTAAEAWSTVRNAESEADVEAGSLAYTDALGRELRTAGAKVLVDTADELAEVRHRAPLDLSLHQGPVLWISLLGWQTAGDARRFLNLAFMTPDNIVQPPDADGDEDEAFSLGVSSSANPSGWSVFNRSQSNGRQVAQSAVPTDRMSLVLVRVEPNIDGGESERYTLWVNPLLGTPPPEADGLSIVSVDAGGLPASDFNDWTDLIGMRIGAGTARNGLPAVSWLVDEIRLGADWTDALPWSPPLEWLPPLPAPGPEGFVVTWRPAPGRTDVVESSTDLVTWTPYEASRRTGIEGETSASFTVPAAPAGATRFLVRVRREP
jgi:hypothetical protein